VPTPGAVIIKLMEITVNQIAWFQSLCRSTQRPCRSSVKDQGDHAASAILDEIFFLDIVYNGSFLAATNISRRYILRSLSAL